MESSSKELIKGTELTIRGLREVFECLSNLPFQKVDYIYRIIDHNLYKVYKDKVYKYTIGGGYIEKELTLKEFEEIVLNENN